jgi:uncharacterized membrane protein YphA (DoxX/SURF4 family)
MHPPSSRGGSASWDARAHPSPASDGALHGIKVKLDQVRAQPQLGLDVLRIYLGIALFVRGILFLNDMSPLNRMLADSWFTPYALAHAVVMAHLSGGILLAVGCYTRLAAAVQIPLLAGAVFLHLREGLLGPSQSLELSALVLVALVVYAVFGSGPLSLDHYIDRSSLNRASPNAGARAETPAASLSEPDDWAAAPRGVGGLDPHGALVGVDPGLHDSPEAASGYRDVKLELTYVLVALTVLFVLFAKAEYTWAYAVFIASFITFGVWRIGRARLE